MKVFPTPFKVTQKFGNNIDYYKKVSNGTITKGHEGLDVIPENPENLENWKVYGLPYKGKVVRDFDMHNKNAAYGVALTIWYPEIGEAWQYCHMKENYFNLEDEVGPEALIGFMGNTGNTYGAHVHINRFKVDANGYRLNHDNGTLGGIDPLPVLSQPTKPVELPNYEYIPFNRNLKALGNLNVRDDARLSGKLVNVIKKDGDISVESYVIGQEVNGNKIWYKLRSLPLFIWSGGTNFVPQPEKIPAPSSLPNENLTHDELVVKVNLLAEEKSRMLTNYEELNRFTEDLKIEKQKVDTRVLELEEELRNSNSTTELNRKLSEQLELNKKDFTAKLKEIKLERDNAYVKAFSGWTLIEVPKGPGAIARIPVIALQLYFLIGSMAKNGYVIGWKKGAKLYKQGTGPAYDPSLAK